MMKHRLLLIEDDETFFDAMTALLSAHTNIQIVWQPTGAKGIQAYQLSPFAFSDVIVDFKLPDITGVEVAERIRKINPEQVIQFASGYEEHVVEMAEAGSEGFLFKGRRSPQEMREKILRSIAKYEKTHRIIGRDEYEPSKAELELRSHGIIGRTATTYQMLSEIKAVKDSPFPTLVIGETGTGKELVAKALTPQGKKLVTVNCASYIGRENLLEAELFGYVKGAFTDAKQDTNGLVMQANNNVLFLDEMASLPISAQAKLLRFLQEMKFRRVGDNSNGETPVSFKLICSVQPDIKDRLKDGRFLPDLIERVATLTVQVPPLRERLDDVEPLVRYFQDEFNSNRKPSDQKQIIIATIGEMKKHDWPTNIRGLQNSVKKMLTLCSSKDNIVYPRDFHQTLKLKLVESNERQETEAVSNLSQAVEKFELSAIVAALKKSKTQIEAAVRLAMSPSNLCRKLLKHGINPEEYLLRN